MRVMFGHLGMYLSPSITRDLKQYIKETVRINDCYAQQDSLCACLQTTEDQRFNIVYAWYEQST